MNATQKCVNQKGSLKVDKLEKLSTFPEEIFKNAYMRLDRLINSSQCQEAWHKQHCLQTNVHTQEVHLVRNMAQIF